MRIFHTWDKWECYPAGFYDKKPKDRSLSDEDCKNEYASFLRDLPAFENALQWILGNWINSCEHYLTNESMNRIAWLGQASLCHAKNIPAIFRGGFMRLSDEEQEAANLMALKYLNIWLVNHDRTPLSVDEAQSKTKANLY